MHSDTTNNSSFHLLPILAGISLFTLALLARIYHLDLRPLHGDESVNAHLATAIGGLGYFPYSHENYHGPTFFYAVYLSLLWAHSVFFLRLPIVIFGALLCALPWFLKSVHPRLSLLSAALLSLSPSLIFYSRYAIHEMLLLFFSMIFATALFFAVTYRSRKALCISAIAFAFLVATKETWIITAFSLTCALFVSFNIRDLMQCARQMSRTIALCLIITTLCIIALFTAFAQWPDGMRELLLSIPIWIGHGVGEENKTALHAKSYYYYFSILKIADPISLAGLILSPLLIFARFRGTLDNLYLRWGCFVAVWGLVSSIVYAAIPYKTPWLVINFTLPATLTTATALFLVAKKYSLSNTVYRALALALLAITTFFSYRYIYAIPYGGRNPFSYVHTHEDIKQLVTDIVQCKQTNDNITVLVATDYYWPLPFYFKEQGIGPLYVEPKGAALAPKYDVVILNNNPTEHRPEAKYYRISDVQEVQVYFQNNCEGALTGNKTPSQSVAEESAS